MPGSPLQSYLGVQRAHDRILRQILTEAATDASKRLRAIKGEGIGAQVKRAQLSIQIEQFRMWKDIETLTERSMLKAAVTATDDVAALLAELSASAGVATPEVLLQGMQQAARLTVSNLISRGINGVPLSDRVYKNAVLSNGRIDRIINSALLRNASPREIASLVKGFIHPNTPGGASYAAMRLGRSEVNNAFHTTSIRHYDEQPWINASKWNLSGSHPKADECDEYANETHMPRGKPGVYSTDDIPSKPHPQCFCYITPVTMSDAEFIRAFNRGDFDAYTAQLTA